MRLVASLVLLSAGAAAQQMVWELVAPAGVRHYGHAVAALGELDGDGVQDLALSALSMRVELRSGRDGALLALRESASNGYGQSLAPAGDVDGDGIPDLLVGTPGPYTSSGPCYEGCPVPTPGFVEVVSGKDLSLLLHLGEQGGTDDEFGFAVAGLGDVNGDGHADVAVGAPAHQYHAFYQFAGVPGAVFAFSGADGTLLWTSDGVERKDAYGVALTGLPDLDGDGVRELAVGASGAQGQPSPGAMPGNFVEILSGATGARLRHVEAPLGPSSPVAWWGFGASLAAVPDSDGDGEDELLVGLGLPFAEAYGALRMSLDGHVLASLSTLGPLQSGLGGQLAAGDVTGDGAPELLLGSDGRSELGLFSVEGHWLNGLGTCEQPTWPNAPSYDALASCAALLGDVTGDGVTDFVMGEAGSGGDQWSYGRVRLFAGGELPWTLVAPPFPDDRSSPRLRPALTRTLPTAFSPDTPLVLQLFAPFDAGSPPVFEMPGRVVIGLEALWQPWYGGVLVPALQFSSPFTVSWFVPYETALAIDVPASLPSGLTFYVQAVMGEPGSASGVRFSEAWRGELP